MFACSFRELMHLDSEVVSQALLASRRIFFPSLFRAEAKLLCFVLETLYVPSTMRLARGQIQSCFENIKLCDHKFSISHFAVLICLREA